MAYKGKSEKTKSDAPKQGVRQAAASSEQGQAFGFTAPAAAAAAVALWCTSILYVKYKFINKIVTACCLLHAAACLCLLHAARFYEQVQLVFIIYFRCESLQWATITIGALFELFI